MRLLSIVLLSLLPLTPATAQLPLGFAETQVSVDLVSGRAQPDVAADRLGNVVVVWRGGTELAGTLLRQRYDSAGQPNGGPQLLAGTGTAPIGPQIGFDGEGNSTIVWNDLEAERLVGRHYDVDGEPRGEVFTIANFASIPFTHPALAVAPDGRFIVAWYDPDTGNLLARSTGPDGSSLSTVETTGDIEGIEDIGIAVRSDGRFAIQWHRLFFNLPITASAYIRFYDDQGQPLSAVQATGPSRVYNTETRFSGLSADAAEVVAAYEADEGIALERFTWSGAPLAPATVVNDTANHRSPTLVRAETGAMLLVSVRENVPSTSRPLGRIVGRWLEADGSPRGAPFWMSPTLVSVASSSAAAADGAGGVVVTYHLTFDTVSGLGHVSTRRLQPDRRAGTVQLSPADVKHFEGATQAPITAVRSGGSDGAITVRYRLSGGSATPDGDYQNEDGIITFADGETGPKSATVILRDDPLREPKDETLTVTLSDATGGAQLVAPESGVLTIIDNDFATPDLPPASLQPPFQINRAAPDLHLQPAVATHTSGIHAVAWAQTDAFTGQHMVYARRFDAQGRTLGDAIPLDQVNVLSDVPFRPALAFDAAGGFLAVWGSRPFLFGRYVDAAGMPDPSGAFLIETNDCSFSFCGGRPVGPSVVAIGADTFAVVWSNVEAFSDPPTAVRFRLLDRLGAERSALVTVSFSAIEGRAVSDGAGGFQVVWNPTDVTGLRAQRFNAAGEAINNPLALATDPPAAVSQPAVAIGPGGGPTFVTYRSGTEIYGLYLVGSNIGTPFPISRATTPKDGPAVAVDGAGNTIVAWASQGQEGLGSGLYVRHLNAAGLPRGGEQRLMATRRGDQRHVALTAGPRGDVFAVWESTTPAGEQNILGRLLPTGRCASDARTLCLGGGRFRLTVEWEDFAGRQDSGRAVGLTPDTGAFWFFDEDNIELVVKVLDGTDANGHHWVFYGALSNVAFDLEITDLETGTVARYNNPLGTFASVGDITALPDLDTPAAASAAPKTPRRRRNTGALASFPALPGKGSCVPDTTTLCLGDGRFQVTADLLGVFPAIIDGRGQARPQTDDSGTFWFFDEDNIELIVKVLDGTDANGHHWFFYGALSNVAYELTVTDTDTGISKTYENPDGTFASVGDTTALPDGSP